jgi:hypothetical protein
VLGDQVRCHVLMEVGRAGAFHLIPRTQSQTFSSGPGTTEKPIIVNFFTRFCPS